MAKSFVDRLLDRIFDASWKGRRGEKLTEKELNLVKIFGRGGKVLRNVYIPKRNGETSEIDLVFITPKGIYVLESKNYSGWIFGDEKSTYWTAMLPNREKNQFYNPIMQNRTHIKWLTRYLKDEIPMFSIIVFSEHCELKKITVDSTDVKVVKRDWLYKEVCNIWDNSKDWLNESQMIDIYEKLKPLTKVSKTVKVAHVENIKAKYKNPTNSTQTSGAHAKEICPQCGGKLVIRVARKGANIGTSFYGCTNFPRCRYVRSLEEIKKTGK